MEETDIHDALDVDSAATLAVTANQVKAELRRASANIPNHNDNIPNVVNYLCKYNNLYYGKKQSVYELILIIYHFPYIFLP